MKQERAVLVADDDNDFRDFFVTVLSEIENEIGVSLNLETAKNGEEAIEKFDAALAEKKPFDIVITDYKMPGKSGVDVVRHVCDKHPVPIVVLSAFPEAQVFDFVKEGAIKFLSKPFQFEQLCEILAGAIQLSGTAHELKRADSILKKFPDAHE
jgi:DNA-binding NtrC family response regulator